MTVELLLGALCWEDSWLCKTAISNRSTLQCCPKGKGQQPNHINAILKQRERRCLPVVPKLLPPSLFVVHCDTL